MSSLINLTPRDHGKILSIYYVEDGHALYPAEAADLTEDPVVLVRLAGAANMYEIHPSDGVDPRRCVGINLDTCEISGDNSEGGYRYARIVDHGYTTAFAPSVGAQSVIEPQRKLESAANGNMVEVTLAANALRVRGRSVTKATAGKRFTVFMF
jgi:hypothetical protein